jgi:uncharacterized protein YjbJ (UPF0337 family)
MHLAPPRQDRPDHKSDEHGGTGIMSGTTDKAKGRIKEAAGALTDDEKLRREGKLDQAVGKVKDAAEKVVDKVRDTAKGKR